MILRGYLRPSAQNLANKLGGNRKVIAWEGEVKVFENGRIEGAGACKEYRAGQAAQDVAPPVGSSAARGGKFVKLGQRTNVTEIRATWKVTHPPGTQSESSIEYFMTQLRAGDMYVWLEPIYVFEHNGISYLLDGHHRIRAAVNINYQGLIPVRKLTLDELPSYTPYRTIQNVIDNSFNANW